VYAHTGPLPTPADFLKYGTLVKAIEVKQPPPPQPVDEEKREEGRGKREEGDGDKDIVEQGQVTVVRETVVGEHMEIGPMPPTRAAPVATPVTVETLETPGTVNFPLPPARYYTVVGVSNRRNRRGPYAAPIRVPLVSPLEAPPHVEADYTASAIALKWPGHPDDVAPAATTTAAAAPGTAPVSAPIENSGQETPGTYEIYADLETPGTTDAPWPGAPPALRLAPPPSPRFGYNVYEIRDGAPPIAPLNSALLVVPAFSDPRVEFGSERCYVVRRVEMAGTVAIESPASPPACVTPVDTFAPTAPKSLVSVATGTAVSLIWEASSEPDLAGYLVLRGDAPGDKLAPLTQAPITETAYIDSSVRSNRSYVYEVVAVDKSGNQSAASNRIEETIR
jgi:hypothetical protein